MSISLTERFRASVSNKKMIIYDFLSTLSGKFSVIDINLFIINLIFAIILLAVGIFLGKFIKFLLLESNKKVKIKMYFKGIADFVRDYKALSKGLS